MATDAQLNANRENAQHSAGPQTETGKSNAARNALTLGLYTRTDHVRPEEGDLYKDFCDSFQRELNPEGLLEQTFAAEITGASWRLRRCNAVEADLADYADKDPMLDESTDKARRSIERARAQAHTILNRSVNQLRRLQTERACRQVMNARGDDAGLADYQHVVIAANNYEKGKHLHAKTREIQGNQQIAQAMQVAPLEDASVQEEELGSICKIARNALCPCNSGEKYKRCCGRNAPPVLSKAA